MTAADDRPEIAPSDEEVWLDHESPAYRKFIAEIDLDDTRPGVPAEKVLAWVKSWGTENELPKPKAE